MTAGEPPRPPRKLTPDSVEPVARIGTSRDLYFPLSDDELRELVRAALDEDGAFSDLTTVATVVSDRRARAALIAREAGVVAGLPFAIEAFRLLDPKIVVRVDAADGSRVQEGAILAFCAGHARALLSAERVALNFMQRLSGIATLTRRYVDAVAGTSAKILDTRKTTPGWRRLEKYAVRAGGGVNHRFDLASAVLVKDNHLAAADGDVQLAVQRARELAPPGTPIEIECDTLEQVRLALDAGAEVILLDNMPLEHLAESVRLSKGRALTEASGGVRLENVRRIAETGVDRISVGALTHSAPALDLALDFD
jgi:nicotinate-nucleotide pyrophosphorylase (carboxylating)